MFVTINKFIMRLSGSYHTVFIHILPWIATQCRTRYAFVNNCRRAVLCVIFLWYLLLFATTMHHVLVILAQLLPVQRAIQESRTSYWQIVYKKQKQWTKKNLMLFSLQKL